MKKLSHAAPWLAVLIGISVTLLLFYPGYMSWDSAYQWWQVRHGLINPAHPPIMVLIWQCTNALLPGPGGYFIFQTCLYWCALGLFVSALNLRPWLKLLVVLGLGFWPPLWGLSLHLWKDIGTVSFFCLAAACLAQDYHRPHQLWRLSALLCVVLGCLYRYNALSAGVFFIIYIVHRDFSFRCSVSKRRKIKVAVISLTVLGGIQLILMSPTYLLNLKSEPLWPLQAQWDIAAVSVYENKLLFPPGWTSPKLTMAVLKRDFDPSVNVPIFNSSLIYVNPYYSMSDHDYAVLKKTWLWLPIEHPHAYWQHRWYVTQNLLGWRQDSRHPNFVFAPGIVPYKDNPTLVVTQAPAANFVQAALLALIETPLFFGWIYVLLALFVTAWAWRKKCSLAIALSLSALGFVMPLILLAPSCDFRYLAWLLQGSLLALLALFALSADKHVAR